MEQNKLPKNIRQIGEKEDWIRVYIEDYVHTYIQRLRGLQEGGISGGILLGKRQRINGIMHLFIRGAVVAPDPFWRDNSQTPGQLRAESSVYFPEMEICGFFVSSRQNRSSEVDLVRIFETHFPSEYQILFNVRDQEEEVFSYSGHGLIRLAGYYIYYEKNEEMQSYIIRQESLRVLERQNGPDEQRTGDRQEIPPVGAAKNRQNQQNGQSRKMGKAGKKIFGVKGDTRAGQEIPDREKRAESGRKPAAGKKMQKGDVIVRIVSIAGIFILAFLLFSDQIKFSRIDEQTGDSMGILSSILNESSAVPAGADSVYIETGAGVESSGNGGAAAGADGTAGANGTEGGDKATAGNETANGNGETAGNGAADGNETTGVNGTVDGNGASNGSGISNGNETSNGNGTIGESKTDGESRVTGANAYVFPMRYLVKKGDSLYSICEKYYGNTEMVDAVCLENDISDPSKLKYGTVLTLPAR